MSEQGIAKQYQEGRLPIVQYDRGLDARRIYAIYIVRDGVGTQLVFTDGTREYVATLSAECLAAAERSPLFDVVELDAPKDVPPSVTRKLGQRNVVGRKWFGA